MASASDTDHSPGPAAHGGAGTGAFDLDREWPFFPDEEKLRVFDPRANVAILIGHTEVDGAGTRASDPPLALLLQHLPASIEPTVLAAIGTIATLRDGVERVVQNLLTNPYITVLFLCGEDSPVFFPLEGLACLYRNGVDEGRHVVPGDPGGRAAKIFARDALATLSCEDIACFRARPLEIVDCRGPVDPATFFADVAARLPERVRRVGSPSWAFLETLDVYRWRPRTLQVTPTTLARPSGLRVLVSGDGEPALVIEHAGGDAGVRASGRADGRAQRALHTVVRKQLLRHEVGWEGRLAAVALDAERAVLVGAFPSDAKRAGMTDPDRCDPSTFRGAEAARSSRLALDPRGFFKVRVLYEQGTLVADYHETSGRHIVSLHARCAEDLLAAIVDGNYLGDPPAREQHLIYLAIQIARAEFALRTGLVFEEGQPLSTAARKNVEHHLYAGAVITGSSLEETWVRGLARLREDGLVTSTQKGRVVEGWCTFFAVPAMAEIAIPEAYPATDEHIENYAEELMAPAPDVRARGDYTYGDRTCHYCFDQIAEAGRLLAADPDRPRITQRWLPEVDLPSVARHRPCLVFDFWYVRAGRLHTLQIARSHDVYGGLPQNALGVARGWGRTLARASGLELGDLTFLSISNNFRVGDDAENVRRTVRRGVHAAALARTGPLPVVFGVDEDDVPDRLGGAREPVAAALVAQLADRSVGTPAEILGAAPALAARLLRYRGALDQVRTLTERLCTEVVQGGRDRSNSLLISPRDPLADRAREATPLVCLQVRRQLGRLHAASVVLGVHGAALAPLVLDLQRAIARAAGIPLGSAVVVRLAVPARMTASEG